MNLKVKYYDIDEDKVVIRDCYSFSYGDGKLFFTPEKNPYKNIVVFDSKTVIEYNKEYNCFVMRVDGFMRTKAGGFDLFTIKIGEKIE